MLVRREVFGAFASLKDMVIYYETTEKNNILRRCGVSHNIGICGKRYTGE